MAAKNIFVCKKSNGLVETHDTFRKGSFLDHTKGDIVRNLLMHDNVMRCTRMQKEMHMQEENEKR